MPFGSMCSGLCLRPDEGDFPAGVPCLCSYRMCVPGVRTDAGVPRSLQWEYLRSDRIQCSPASLGSDTRLCVAVAAALRHSREGVADVGDESAILVDFYDCPARLWSDPEYSCLSIH